MFMFANSFSCHHCRQVFGKSAIKSDAKGYYTCRDCAEKNKTDWSTCEKIK